MENVECETAHRRVIGNSSIHLKNSSSNSVYNSGASSDVWSVEDSRVQRFNRTIHFRSQIILRSQPVTFTANHGSTLITPGQFFGTATFGNDVDVSILAFEPSPCPLAKRQHDLTALGFGDFQCTIDDVVQVLRRTIFISAHIHAWINK